MDRESIRISLKWKIIAVVLAMLGTLVQVFILVDILVRRLDFTLSPEGVVLQQVAIKSFFTAPLIAILVTWFVMKRSVRWAPAAAGIACPMVISMFYLFAITWAGFDWMEFNNSAGMTRFGLFQTFFRYALLFSAIGGGIGLLIGAGIERFASMPSRDAEA